MKREFRFRIYNKKEDKMYLSPEEIKDLGAWFDAHFNWSKSDENDLIVMQSTGLKDKNGTTIFEGDYLANVDDLQHDRIVVEWNNNFAHLQINGYYQGSDGEEYCEYHVLMFNDELEVIGNIHELNTEKMNTKKVDFNEQVSQLIGLRSGEVNFEGNERKTLTSSHRLSICSEILSKYSSLKDNKGILHAQMFSAMEEYLKVCTEINYNIVGI